MNRKTLYLAAATILAFVLIIFLMPGLNESAKNLWQPASGKPPAADSPTAPVTPTASRQKPGGPYAPADPRWSERTRKLKVDPQYEWKTPIEFYGKVVDQDGQPVEEATADVIWTDISASGSSHMKVKSDTAGLFAITGIRGKHMTVQVNKAGYYRQLTDARTSFEFAGFWEPTYHVPDEAKPVVFRLRKKGEAAPLARSSGKVVLTFGVPVRLPLPKTNDGNAAIEVTIVANDAKPRNWQAKISLAGGGIQATTEEFPFLAPEGGYRESIEVNQNSPRPTGWQDLHQGGVFYFRTSKKYGLLKIQQMVGRRTLHYEILLNERGERGLEPPDSYKLY